MSVLDERVTRLNDREVRKGRYVLYWMQQSQRVEYNHALNVAIREANRAGLPLLVAFGLTDAYPEATPTGTVFLSAFTTKMALYALARGFPGTEALVYIGALMTCFPIFYAVIENDLRRVLEKWSRRLG